MHERIKPGVDDIRTRHIKRQQQHRRMMKRRRIIFFTVLTLIMLFIVLFFTPLFNIKHINIYGNSKIETAVIKQAVGSIEEENLFRLSKRKIVKNISTLPYVDDVKITKKVLPVGINVNVTECMPVGYVVFGNEYVAIDKNLKVLEVSDMVFEGIGEIAGIDATAANPGSILASDDAEKLKIVEECISVLIDNEIISKIGKIDFSDMSNIVFTYENRLNVVCGSSIDFSKKAGMLIKAVNSSKLTANSRGTMDISISGKAIYTP